MKKQIFAIVGYTNWGKSHTLYELFDRKNLQPLYSPIKNKKFGSRKFTVINASNEDKPTKEYLERIKKILKLHKDSESTYVITISLYFDGGRHEVNSVFNYLNSLNDYEIHYVVLTNGWSGGCLTTDDLRQMKNKITTGKIHSMDTVINQSKKSFSERTQKIATLINYL